MIFKKTRIASPETTSARPWLAALGIMLVASSCRDVAAPNDPLNSGHRPSFTSINAPGLVTVTPDSMRGWVFYDDQAGSVCSDTSLCNFVDGPAGAPSGTGSAELAVLSTAGGKALIIPDYGGVRLDQVTTLSYSTYRQTVDNGNNLAIALQLNVDYDLSDASTGYQGRLVYEPYQTSGGQVPQSTWQTWNTMAGRWWGTRASVVRNGQTIANPCAQSSPCTWTQVLTYFPNIGVHATMGAIVLKAGSGWTNFRGNVDNFVIGISGSTTTFDFELRAGAPPHLRTSIGAEVVSALVWPTDSVYAPGTVVNYTFAARPGRAVPIVLLDDTLAAPSGQFVMNGDHALIAESDTIYSYATLQPLEKSIADLEKSMLTSSNKVADSPGEFTYILVTNGIFNSLRDANGFLRAVLRLARTQDRFRKDYTTIALHYNRNHEAEMADWDKDHPCIKPYDGLGWKAAWLLTQLSEYMDCTASRGLASIRAQDLAESYRLREAKLTSLPVDHPETVALAMKVRQLRDRYRGHVILVDHSEGTLIAANAFAMVEAADGHPLNTSNRCVAMLALAPALPRSAVGLDQYHLTGLLAEHDVLRISGISNPSDWESITTPLGDSLDTYIATVNQNPLLAAVGGASVIEKIASLEVHKVAQYLSEPTNSTRFVTRLTTLHKECVAGSGTLSLTPSTASVGSTVKLSASIINQNGRPLIGRTLNPSDPSPMLQKVDSVTYLAYAPPQGVGQMSLRVSDNLTLNASFSVPLLSVPTNLTTKDSLWWTVIGGSNGGLGSPAPGPIPTSGSCGEVRRVPGEGESYVDYLGNCATLYHVDYNVPSSLSSGLALRGGLVTWKHLDGTQQTGSDDAICGGVQPCLESVKVEWIDTFGGVVARTLTPIQ